MSEINYEYKKMHPFKWFILENYPFLEDSIDTLTNYQLFCKLGEEINKNRDSINEIGENETEVVTAFNNLYDYVHDYFNNLDVQDEVDNKLDQMASTGQLQTLLNQQYNELRNEVNVKLNAQDLTISNRMDNQDTTISNAINSLENIASGSPAGVYDTVGNLTSADPDHSRIYVVTATGNWYYYNTTNNSWVSGGTYQSTGIGENDVKPYQEESIIKESLIPYGNWINNKTIQGSNGAVINFDGGSYCSEHIPMEAETNYTWISSINLESGKTLKIAFYDNNDTYISTISTYVRFGNNVVITTPANTSYGIVHSYALTLGPVYPSNYPILVKTSDVPNLKDWSKPIYLNEKYQMIDNNNVYCQDKIQWVETVGNTVTTIPHYFAGVLNRYTISASKTISSNDYPYWPFHIKDITPGDKIRIKFLVPNEHVTSLGVYPLTSTSSSRSLTLNSSTGEYELTLTSEMINTLFTDGYARICTRITNISGETNVAFTMQINANNLCNNFDDIVEKLNNIDTSISYKGMFLGDSITQLTGDRSWITYFSQIIPLSSTTNVSVIGATLMDKENTVYDGNPVYDGPDNNENNVLGNQVQKILNNNYTAPDFIFIAIGTNGGITFTDENEIYNTYWNSDGSVKPLSSVDRTTSAGAFRYTNEKLHEAYPNAMIVWCTPIQANTLQKNVNQTIQYGENLKVLCNYGSNYCIDSEKCGILGINEKYNQNGEDLADGLHPNSHGAKKLGLFNACEFKKFLDEIDLI